MANQRLCTIPDCGKKRYGHGYCNAHWHRFKKYGDPLEGRTPNGEGLRFLLSHVNTDEEDCIQWPYGKSNGYGIIQHEGRPHYAHALICTLANGDKPDGMDDAAHSCGNRACINPHHLRWATRLDNVSDAIGHGTIARGDKLPHTKLTPEAVRSIRSLRGKLTQDEIGAMFGIHRAHVKDIQQRRRWGWLP